MSKEEEKEELQLPLDDFFDTNPNTQSPKEKRDGFGWYSFAEQPQQNDENGGR